MLQSRTSSSQICCSREDCHLKYVVAEKMFITNSFASASLKGAALPLPFHEKDDGSVFPLSLQEEDNSVALPLPFKEDDNGVASPPLLQDEDGTILPLQNDDKAEQICSIVPTRSWIE
ncbi:hypothetical protein E5676_scaffold388G00380 [Cucumis melo var. makuwa]|uniref:Uncharacterized protein n=1 Tax=Cucumis melo var. makuwa TaxID=1194695 RepID=A0A5D3BT38_CUCMM|nr:hypothetical protein E5676_scaffold388G00380 [Cucumis melo var. makuwa]